MNIPSFTPPPVPPNLIPPRPVNMPAPNTAPGVPGIPQPAFPAPPVIPAPPVLNNGGAPKDAKQRKWVFIVLAVTIFSLILAGCGVWLFVSLTTNQKSQVFVASPTVQKVIDVSDLERNKPLTRVTSGESGFYAKDHYVIRYHEDNQDVLIASAVNGENWTRAIDPSDTVSLSVNGNICVLGKNNLTFDAVTGQNTQAPEQKADINKIPDKSAVFESTKNQFRDDLVPDALKNVKGLIKTGLLYEGGQIFFADNTLYYAKDKEKKWELRLPDGVPELNHLRDENPVWKLEGNVLLLASKQGVHAIDVRTGKELWNIAEANLLDWSVLFGGNIDPVVILHSGKNGKSELRLYSFKTGTSGASEQKSEPIKQNPEDLLARAFKDLEGKEMGYMEFYARGFGSGISWKENSKVEITYGNGVSWGIYTGTLKFKSMRTAHSMIVEFQETDYKPGGEGSLSKTDMKQDLLLYLPGATVDDLDDRTKDGFLGAMGAINPKKYSRMDEQNRLYGEYMKHPEIFEQAMKHGYAIQSNAGYKYAYLESNARFNDLCPAAQKIYAEGGFSRSSGPDLGCKR